MNRNRFIPDNPHAYAMEKFTRKLTSEIWNKALVVLTCANACEAVNPHLRNKSKGEKKAFFKKLVNDYKAAIHQTLKKKCKVPAATVEKVKVVPVGIEFEPELLDGTLWFSNFWFECLTAIPTIEGRVAMTKLNQHRFKSGRSVQQATNATQAETSSPEVTEGDNTVELTRLANDLEMLDKIKETKEFKFIVIGQGGTGKSTLINGLIGAEVAKVEEGFISEGVTKKVESYSRKIDDIEVVAYDSPGLEDGSGKEEDYLEEIYQTCQQGIDLVIFAVPMTGGRFVPDNPDARAIVKFTHRLTPEIWKNTVVVLTHANRYEAMNPHLKSKSEEERKTFFKTLVSDYKAAIHQTLKETGIPAATVEKVKVVPVGIEFEPKLLDGTLWFSDFWCECHDTIPSAKGRVAMTQLNRRRFQSVTASDFQLPIHDQPIVVQRSRNIASSTGIVTGYVATGAALGALGFIAGPLGIVTLSIGLVVGAVIGAAAIKRDPYILRK